MRYIIVAVLCFMFSSTSAQHMPYSFNKNVDIGVTSTIAAGAIAYYILNSRVEPLQYSDVEGLSSADLLSMNESAVAPYSSSNAKRSRRIALTGTITGLGLQGITVLAASKHTGSFWEHAGIIGTMLLQVNGAAYYGAGIAKTTVLNPRPYVYDNSNALKSLEKEARYSFFSRHTSVTAANTFFTAHVISNYYAPSAFTYSVWGAAAVLPAAVGFFRVQSGEHFPTDVIAGYAWGAACGLLIPYLHKKRENNNSQVHFNIYGAQYMSLSYVW